MFFALNNALTDSLQHCAARNLFAKQLTNHINSVTVTAFSFLDNKNYNNYTCNWQ